MKKNGNGKNKTVKNEKMESAPAAETTVETPQATVTVETPQAQVSTEAVAETKETKRLGRPIVPGSNRQMAIAERERKMAAGELKRGRKPNPGSKRQAHLERRAQLLAEGKLTGKKGRPINGESKHQKALAEKQARIAANGGVPLKPGRPKVVKVATEEKVEI